MSLAGWIVTGFAMVVLAYIFWPSKDKYSPED